MFTILRMSVAIDVSKRGQQNQTFKKYVVCIHNGRGDKIRADRTERDQGFIELRAERKWHCCEFIYDLLKHIRRNVSNLRVGNKI